MKVLEGVTLGVGISLGVALMGWVGWRIGGERVKEATREVAQSSGLGGLVGTVQGLFS